MLCFLCGEKVGFLRSLVDQQYCCAEHRRQARLAATEVFREEEEVEMWAVSRSRKKAQNAKSQASAGQTASIFAFLIVGALLVAALLLPGPGPGPAFPDVSLDPSIQKGLLARAGDALGSVIRTASPVTLQQSFPSSGFGAISGTASVSDAAASLSDWATVNLRTPTIDDPRDWTGGTRRNFASLRLWSSSTIMQNYEMEFEAQIEKTSLSWAFRSDSKADNYYATKLMITKPGPLPNAQIIRYAVINGRERDLVQLPVPATLERGEDYQIRVAVQDNRFITFLNGRPISNWSDDRLIRGGVGFFDDANDPQQIAWVRLSERDSFLGRMLSNFSLLVIPGQAPRAR